jgi:hypothetical protein
VQLLLERYPAAAAKRNSFGLLPFHCAAGGALAAMLGDAYEAVTGAAPPPHPQQEAEKEREQAAKHAATMQAVERETLARVAAGDAAKLAYDTAAEARAEAAQAKEAEEERERAEEAEARREAEAEAEATAREEVEEVESSEAPTKIGKSADELNEPELDEPKPAVAAAHGDTATAVELTLDMDITDIPPASAARDEFEAGFRVEVSELLSCERDYVRVRSIRAGSVIVACEVLHPEEWNPGGSGGGADEFMLRQLGGGGVQLAGCPVLGCAIIPPLQTDPAAPEPPSQTLLSRERELPELPSDNLGATTEAEFEAGELRPLPELPEGGDINGETEREAGVEEVVEPEVAVEAESEADVEAGPQLTEHGIESNPEPAPELEPELEPVSESEPTPATESIKVAEPELDAEVMAAAEAEPESEVKQKPGLTSEPDINSHPEPDSTNVA